MARLSPIVAMIATLALMLGGSCTEERTETRDSHGSERARMVRETIEARGVRDRRVLAAMRKVKRHLFVPRDLENDAYQDNPLPIGEGQTISQPYIVALMTQLADVERGERVLEVGTGSGYQAAVLAELGARVWSIEISKPLADSARDRLGHLGYRSIEVRQGDGYRGWREHAPFGAIVVTAAPPRIPDPLLAQLAIGGKLVVPVGSQDQELLVITRTSTGYDRQRSIPVQFVPMTGEIQRQGR